MGFEHKDNQGSLFRNDEVPTDSHPTHGGSAKIDGTDYWISAWVNESDKGTKYFSLRFKKKEARPGGKLKRDKDGKVDVSATLSDDIPF